MASSGHSAVVDSFEIICYDLFISFGCNLGYDLVDVFRFSIWTLQHCRFVDIDETQNPTKRNPMESNHMILVTS